MSRFAIIVTIKLEPGSAEVFKPHILANAAAAVREEPDCHLFHVSQAEGDPDTFFFYEVYTDAADYGIAEVTTASTFRLGEVYEKFSTDLMDSERPGELDEAALEQYELLLEEQIYPFEEKAIDIYKANTDRAADGVYDEWVRRSFNRLATLMPARYAKRERSEDVVTALY